MPKIISKSMQSYDAAVTMRNSCSFGHTCPRQKNKNYTVRSDPTVRINSINMKKKK